MPPDVEDGLGVEGEGPGKGAEGRVQWGLGTARRGIVLDPAKKTVEMLVRLSRNVAKTRKFFRIANW